MRLVLMPGYLRDKASHPYSETLGWRRWCAERDIELQVFGHRLLEREVIAATGATPAFGMTAEELEALGVPREPVVRDPVSGIIDSFMRGSLSAARACRIAWAAQKSRPDAVIFPWGHQGQMNGIADWLADLSPGERPKVAINIVRAESDWVADAERRNVSGEFSFMRFAGRRLRMLLGEERLVLTAVDPRLCRTLEWACETPVKVVAPHVTYPSREEFAAWRPPSRSDSDVLIGMMGLNRGEKSGAYAPAMMAAIAAQRPQARFFLQASGENEARLMAQALEGRGVRLQIQVGGLDHDEYWRRLLANDLMIMPYFGKDYALTPSGPFCEALASGIPVVAPRHTWMGDRLADGLGAGDTFDTVEVADVARATIRAIDMLPQLKARAATLAPAWLASMSLDAHIGAIIGLLGLGDQASAGQGSSTRGQ